MWPYLQSRPSRAGDFKNPYQDKKIAKNVKRDK